MERHVITQTMEPTVARQGTQHSAMRLDKDSVHLRLEYVQQVVATL
jgi:hypothetical protein